MCWVVICVGILLSMFTWRHSCFVCASPPPHCFAIYAFGIVVVHTSFNWIIVIVIVVFIAALTSLLRWFMRQWNNLPPPYRLIYYTATATATATATVALTSVHTWIRTYEGGALSAMTTTETYMADPQLNLHKLAEAVGFTKERSMRSDIRIFCMKYCAWESCRWVGCHVSHS